MLDALDGTVLQTDQTPDLNEVFDLGLSKPHHASMNGGTVVADGMIFVPFGGQNNPSGGILAYEVNHRPIAADDVTSVFADREVVIDALANDEDPDGDLLRFASVAGQEIDDADGAPDEIILPFGTVTVFNRGDDVAHPKAAYLRFVPSATFRGRHRIQYTVEDLPPYRVVNGIVQNTPEPTHRAQRDSAELFISAME